MDEVERKLAELYARAVERQQITMSRRQRWAATLADRVMAMQMRDLARELRKRKCGARTRRGTPCQCKGLGRGGRCKLHGGMSTGPKTEAGKLRISEANRRRAGLRRIACERASARAERES